MHTQRETAIFSKINEILKELDNSENTKRVRIIGAIVKIFTSNDGKYAFLVVDDGSETIRAKAFRDLSIFENLEEGNLIQLIGWAKFYNEEVYIQPEIVSKLSPNEFYFLKIKLIKSRENIHYDGEIVEFLQENPKSSVNEIQSNLNISKELCIKCMRELMNSSLVYEPMKGVYSVV